MKEGLAGFRVQGLGTKRGFSGFRFEERAFRLKDLRLTEGLFGLGGLAFKRGFCGLGFRD